MLTKDDLERVCGGNWLLPDPIIVRKCRAGEWMVEEDRRTHKLFARHGIEDGARRVQLPDGMTAKEWCD